MLVCEGRGNLYMVRGVNIFLCLLVHFLLVKSDNVLFVQWYSLISMLYLTVYGNVLKGI